MKLSSLSVMTASALLCSGAFAQNGADNPGAATALAAGPGAWSFDLSNCDDTGAEATEDPAFPSSCTTGIDAWFTWSSTSTTDILIDACGTSWDTEITIWDGNPAAGGNEIACNDDFCGLQSGLQFSATSGSTYYIQIGWWQTGGGAGLVGFGAGTIAEVAPPPPPPTDCITTLFDRGNGGAADGGVFMDFNMTGTVTYECMQIHTSVAGGGPIGVDIYTTALGGTYDGSEMDPTLWTLVASGSGVGQGAGTPSTIVLNAPWTPPVGSYGVAIVGTSGTDHDYTNGNGTNEIYTDSNVTITCGSAMNAPFVAGTVFSPRVFNGSFCETCAGGNGIGMTYCSPNANNSTGNPGSLAATGSTSAAANDVTLDATDLPNNQFGYFLNSMAQGFVPMPNMSQGNLCVVGQIGRYVGNIFNTGATGTGSLTLDLTNTPTPSGPVSIMAGETWNFQAWYRDVNPTATSNFTDAVSITFN